MMKVSVKKDGHHFYTHINQVVVDLAGPPPQPQDKDTNGKKEDFKSKDANDTTDIKQCPVILGFSSTILQHFKVIL